MTSTSPWQYRLVAEGIDRGPRYTLALPDHVSIEVYKRSGLYQFKLLDHGKCVYDSTHYSYRGDTNPHKVMSDALARSRVR